MKRLLWLILFLGITPHLALALAPACNASDPSQTRLQISVSGMHTTKGRITISIYPDVADEFLKGRYKLGQQHLPVVLPVTQACFVMPAPGYYAVALFGDENSDNHFATNALGMPAEGYGFSNNPHLYFGPPGLGKVRFAAHAGDNQIAVRMQYYP